jgi:hypothetical protein
MIPFQSSRYFCVFGVLRSKVRGAYAPIANSRHKGVELYQESGSEQPFQSTVMIHRPGFTASELVTVLRWFKAHIVGWVHFDCIPPSSHVQFYPPPNIDHLKFDNRVPSPLASHVPFSLYACQ